MDEIKVFRAALPRTLRQVHVFARDATEATSIIGASYALRPFSMADWTMLHDVTDRLLRGNGEASMSTRAMIETGFVGIATWEAVEGWVPVEDRGEDK